MVGPNRGWAVGLGLALTMSGAAWAGPKADRENRPLSLEVWVRGAGPGRQGKLKKEDSLMLNLRTVPWVQEERSDVQYGKKLRFRGVLLSAILARHPKGLTYDAALIHFANGMIISVPLGVAGKLDDWRPMIALEVEWEQGGKKQWTSEFPDLKKKGAEDRDRRPLRFFQNKFVSNNVDHPATDVAAKGFSPWLFADSVSGIELVNQTAYDRQFERGEGELAALGLKRYQQYCQFCHGVHQVGARLGWDFAEPISVPEYRSAKSLYLHVSARASDAPEKGLLMPAFKTLSERDAEGLWTWLNAVSQEGTKDYQP